MTASAQHFVTPLTFQALSGHQVYTALIEDGQEQSMNHIHLARWADQLIIAPATANIIAKMAHGLADDLLSTLYLVAECPIFIAPAMNQAMWRKPVVQENIARLKLHGVQLIGPEAGEQACGEVGLGRLSEPEQVCKQLLGNPTPKKLENVKLLITAGPTREPIDPVRFISNRSSGKMGYALARAAVNAGAQVTLVSGPVNLSAPAGVSLVSVETAKQMYEAVMTHVHQSDIYIGAAAVADYRPVTVDNHKLKKNNDNLTMPLHKNIDIIAEVAQRQDKPFVVGFAAETDDLETYARQKLIQKNLDMIAANWVGRPEGGFDHDKNALQVYWLGGQQNFKMADKSELAEQLLDLIVNRFHAKHRKQAD
jgi:phosphopantothenoylcysteine decarboxylase/phosphopantothenate--cysteine ligase